MPAPSNLFSQNYLEQIVPREVEAPSEPSRRKLGRNHAPPIVLEILGIAKMSVTPFPSFPANSK